MTHPISIINTTAKLTRWKAFQSLNLCNCKEKMKI